MMAPKPEKANNHLLFLNSFRALTAIYVLLHHATIHYYNPFIDNHLKGFQKIYFQTFFYGHFAVNMFIVLSGFSLMLSVTKNGYNLKGGSWAFYKRRIVRIIPPYYLAILFSIVLIWLFIGSPTGTHWDGSTTVTFGDILRHLFLIHDFFASTQAHINHVFWSIAVECPIYIFFPLLVFLWRKTGPVVTLTLSVIIAVTGVILLIFLGKIYRDINMFSSGVSPYIILFTLGMLAADMAFAETGFACQIRTLYLKSSVFKRIICSIAFLIVALGVNQLIDNAKFPGNNNLSAYFIDVLFGVIVGCMLFLCSIYSINDGKANLAFRFLNARPLAFIGSFSYSLYLIHAPLLQIISQYMLSHLAIDEFSATLLLSALGVMLIIPFSYLFFLVCERPFLKYGMNTNRNKIAKPAVISN